MQKFQTLVSKEGHRQRKQTQEKENPCDRNEKTRSEKKKKTDEEMDEQKGDLKK